MDYQPDIVVYHDKCMDGFTAAWAVWRRWGDGGEAKDCTVSISGTDECPADAFVCPEQTGRVDACGKCGACWASKRNVAFVAH